MHRRERLAVFAALVAAAVGCSTAASQLVDGPHDGGPNEPATDSGKTADGHPVEPPPDADNPDNPDTGIPPAPEGTSTVMYGPAVKDEFLAYSRVVRLAHGAANGTLLASFERSFGNGAPSQYVVRKSGDDGLTWSTLSTIADHETGPGHPAPTFYQPFLFELPTTMGSYPAGTLLMIGNVVPRIGGATKPQFQLWRSTDTGATWTFVTIVQEGDLGDLHGIWEPFLDIDGKGQLVCYFADERHAEHSQIIAHTVSTDGGDTWSANPNGSARVAPGLVYDVASNTKAERPGMPTVATLPNGNRILAFELCAGGRQTCEIRTKTSTDGGATWGAGPTDTGSLVQTNDGRYAASSPYVVVSAKGQLLLGSMRARNVSDNGLALEDYQAVFVNTQGGNGAWSWMPAPQPIEHEAVPSPCYMNYSPHLLVSAAGGSFRYTTATQNPSTPCAERTATANAGVLPFASSFASGLAAGWKSYGGCWKVEGGVYRDTCGANGVGYKALAGSTGWTDYRLEGDVRLDTAGGNAGFLVRLSNPSVGSDSHRGYFVGILNNLFLGRQNYDYAKLSEVPIPGGTPVGQFFHLTVDVKGCSFALSAKRAGTTDTPTTLSFDDPGCSTTSGAIGVRDFSGGASFRDIRVTGL